MKQDPDYGPINDCIHDPYEPDMDWPTDRFMWSVCAIFVAIAGLILYLTFI